MNIRRGFTGRVLRFAQRVTRAKCVKGEQGTSLVELAITLPIMLTLLTGAASFSLGFYCLQELGNATTSGVQLVAADQGLVTDRCETAAAAVEGGLPNWTTTKLTFTLEWTDSYRRFPFAGSNPESSSTGSLRRRRAMVPPTLRPRSGRTRRPFLRLVITTPGCPSLRFTPSSALSSTQASLVIKEGS